MQRWSASLPLPMVVRLRVLITAALACAAWGLLAAAGPGIASASPAAPTVGTTVQPDGTTFESRVFGDEWANGVETATGYTVVQDQTTGVWKYATRARGNRLKASGNVVGRDRPGNIPKHLRDQVAIAEGADLAASSPLPEPMAAPAPEPFAAPSLVTSTASHKTLVLLASFTDQPSLGTTAASWNDRFFGPTGSLKHYYEEVSYGGLTFAPAEESQGTAGDGIVGWLPLNMPHPNGDNEAVRRAVKAAVEAADPFVDYASFDTNLDGTLVPSELHVTLIVAGYEGSFHTVPGNKVWGHRWSLHGTTNPPTVDGTRVTWSPLTYSEYLPDPGYTTFGEMHNDHQATLGIIAHEIGHDLGWPDLYDTDQTSSGVGNWSVMGGGSWGYVSGQMAGATPSHPDVWSKLFQSWVAPMQVTTSTQNLSVSAAASASNAGVALQVLDNPGGSTDWKFLGTAAGAGEYFLVENRQRTGYDASLPAAGLLVWHVNEAKTSNNDDANRLVDLVEADGLGNLDIAPLSAGWNRGDGGDPYPGTANNRAVSSTTTPNSRFNVSGAYSGATLQAISDSGPTMTADIYVPTANDTFAAATSITGRTSTRTQRITEATRQTGEPGVCGVDRSVWFKYIAPENATIALSTAGTGFDTALGVFTGSSVAGLTSVACNGDAAGAITSALTFTATAGTTYYVQAGNDAVAPTGVGDLSLAMQSSPTAPLNASASRGNASATVTWDAPVSDGGSPITGYTVTSSPGGITTTAGATADEVTVPGLTNGTGYTFTVAATNAVGGGPASAASNAVTPATVPGAPSAVSAGRGDTTATVSWTAPASDGGSPITGYTVTSSPGGITTTTGATADEVTVPGLTNGTAYTFTVTATNDVGAGPASSASVAVTPATTPDAPTDVTAQGGNGQASVTWTQPASDGGSPITGYNVTASPGGLTASASASAGAATITGLTNGTEYTFTVVATNAVGNGAASQPSEPVTPAVLVLVPGAPLDVWAVATEGTTTVGWTAPASDGGAAITGYTVTALPSGNTTAVDGDTTEVPISELINGLASTFTVAATNEAGEGPASIASNAVVPIPNTPPVVTMIAPAKTFALTSTVVVKWTATDDSNVVAHDVRWRRAQPGSPFEAWQEPEAWQGLTTTKAALAGTKPGYTYCFKVRSTDSLGNSSEGAERCTTTPMDDRALTASAGGWAARSDTPYYRKTYRMAKVKDATLTLPSVRTKQVWLVATRCPGCGIVNVTVGGVTTKVPLDHTKLQRKKLIPIASYSTAKTVKVTIKAKSGPGRPVEIDGLGVTTQ